MLASQLVASLQPSQHKRLVCPECSPFRNKAKEKDLDILPTSDGWRYHCHHCDIAGFVPFKSYKPNQIYRSEKSMSVVPLRSYEPRELSKTHYEFLKTRGISEKTAQAMQLFSAEKYFTRLDKKTDAIGFPYFKDGKFVSAKYRSIESKDFTQDAGGAQVFFGLDKIDPSQPVIIVEGEIDALTAIECGIKNVVSVPSGAPLKVSDGKIDATEDKKFSFVWNSFDLLSQVPYVTIATDTDQAGQALAEELARRIGKDKCRIAQMEFKDLNEAFLAEGMAKVQEIINNAEPYPVAGLSSASKFFDRLNDLWTKGTGKGVSTGYDNVDKIYTVAQGQLTIVTGYPSHGKSNFVDQLMVNLGKHHDWKFALCSFENAPEIHISRLMEIYKEKRFFDGGQRMTVPEKEEALQWVEDHFVFLDSEASEASTIDSILERAKIAVARMGIRGMVIDPYNYIENKGGMAEHEFISAMLTRMQAFAKSSGVHVWFVAHPSKISRSGMELPRPDGMAISGSMAWWAKADCGLTIHRGSGVSVEIAVWKCRYRWIGTQGETTLDYNKVTGTYVPPSNDFE
jgi:twinkle protein